MIATSPALARQMLLISEVKTWTGMYMASRGGMYYRVMNSIKRWAMAHPA
jgi:hypothetical protein